MLIFLSVRMYTVLNKICNSNLHQKLTTKIVKSNKISLWLYSLFYLGKKICSYVICGSILHYVIS